MFQKLFVKSHQYIESEEEEELYMSSLLRLADLVGIEVIGSGIEEVVRSTKRRRGKLSEKTSNVR